MQQEHAKQCAYWLAIQAIQQGLASGEMLGEFDERRAVAVEQQIKALIEQLSAEAERMTP